MIRSRLLKLRRRWWWQSFCHRLAEFAVAALGFGAVAFTLLPRREGVLATVALLGVALVAAAIISRLRRPSLTQLALDTDRAVHSQDRLTTGLALEGTSAPLAAAAQASCEAWAKTADLGATLPWRFPRALLWLPLTVLAILWAGWDITPRFSPTLPPDAASLRIATQLEALATRVAKDDDPRWQAVAEALRKSAQANRARATEPDAREQAFRELSKLEALIESTARSAPLEALSEAFSEPEGDLAQALTKQDAEATAQALEKAAAGQGGTPSEALRKALEKLAQEQGQTPMQTAAQAAAKAMEQGDAEAQARALRDMARQMRKGDGKGNPLREALREMKAGNNPSSPDERSGSGQDQQEGRSEGSVAMSNTPDSLPQPGDSATFATGPGDTPGANPGTENDDGSKANPFGAKTADPGEAALQTQLSGLIGEGETLQTLLPTRSGEDNAKTEYQALYQAAAPAAEEALEKEPIPLGSRQMIRRYFEAIRP